MVNGVRFMISKENLTSGPETRFAHRALVWQKFYYSEKGQRKLLTQTSEGAESALLSSVSKGAIYFLN